MAAVAFSLITARTKDKDLSDCSESLRITYLQAQLRATLLNFSTANCLDPAAMTLPFVIRRGILSLPGADAASKFAVERSLKKDYDEHHCYFRPIGFHNHLSHHVLAAYDLGASAPLIQAIFNAEAQIQRPIDLRENGVVPEGIVPLDEIKDDNWTKWLGDQKAYSAYVSFFSKKVTALGITKALEDYVFSPAANGNGSYMLFRLFAGAIHSFIQIGYGLEFDAQFEVASGLAQTAIHTPSETGFLSPGEFHDVSSHGSPSGDEPQRQGHKTTVLAVLRQIYDSPKLIPILPYDPDALFPERFRDLVEQDGGSRITELNRIMSQFDPGETSEEFNDCVEELIFTATLLVFGTGKRGRKPRLDFFLMHLLTSTLLVPAFLKYVPQVEHRKALFRTYLQIWGIMLMICGRPRIDPSLVMSYTDHPMPPNTFHSKAHSSSIDGKNDESVNPWHAIISDALHAPDAHVLKSIRTLLYGATKYGMVSKGGLIGAFGYDGKETHTGIAEVDGTIFIRAAGVLMDSLGWVTHGQEAVNWDRSGLGWDDAWRGED